MKTAAPFGTWESTISAEMVGGKSPRLGEPLVSTNRLFWLESIPEENGRNAIMVRENGENRCLLPRPLSAKSNVHEYGGGSYCVANDIIFFVLADDQRIYRADIRSSPFAPVAITPESLNLRFADLHYDHQRNQLLAICENHGGDRQVNGAEPQNTLVSVKIASADADNTAFQKANTQYEIRTLASGGDFYSTPSVSPDGKFVTWLSWDHPNMPWDESQVWVAEFSHTGELIHSRTIQVGDTRKESMFLPSWSPNGDLFFVSDRNNWWNIYRVAQQQLINRSDNVKPEPITQLNAEFATPQWTFRMSTYSFLNANSIVATYTKDGQWFLATIDLSQPSYPISEVECKCTAISGISADNNIYSFIGASAYSFPAIYHVKNLGQPTAVTNSEITLEKDTISKAQAISFATSENDQAHAFFYAPKNPVFCATKGKLPPLMVICHGGPTGAADNALNLKIQFWTSRGFAVVDVNYRGSTGYGREFREKLYGRWGELDVDDICAATDYLTETGLAAQSNTIVKGSSAGGYTVLAALAFRKTFKLGVSLYGIADLEILAKETHKFESRYMDKLVGKYPQEKAKYHKRSPIHYVDKFDCALLVFQGLQDKVVPPNQADDIVNAVRTKGLPVAYVRYENEGHGFRAAENIEHMLMAEYYFYSQLLGFAHRGSKPLSLKIHNIR